MNRPAHIQIIRSSDDRVYIKIIDGSSRTTIAEASLDMASFGEAITGRGDVYGLVERYPINCDRFGKDRQVREFLLDGRPPYSTQDGKVTPKIWVADEFKKQCADLLEGGWTVWSDGTGTQQKVNDKHKISLQRFVEP